MIALALGMFLIGLVVGAVFVLYKNAEITKRMFANMSEEELTAWYRKNLKKVTK